MLELNKATSAISMLTTTEMKSSSLSRTLILLVLSSGTASGLGSVVSKKYTYHSAHYTWHDARSFCRQQHIDLALLLKQSDGDAMSMSPYDAYIGLYRANPRVDEWVWSSGESEDSPIWERGEPHENDTCGFVSDTSLWIRGDQCDTYHFFYCHKEKPNHYEYKFIPLSKTWSGAQEYCRQHYDDLATFPNIISLNRVVSQNFPVWIGLHREEQTWKWSSGSSDYRDWDQDEPDNSGECVSISSLRRKMATKSCTDRFPFSCYADNILVVKENKTWEEALEHCQSLTSPSSHHHRYDLLSVQPGDDQRYVMTRVTEADTEEVWVSLRFLAGFWQWVNGADMSYPDLPTCPLEWKHCGALSKANMSSVETRDCTERRNFLCYSKDGGVEMYSSGV